MKLCQLGQRQKAKSQGQRTRDLARHRAKLAAEGKKPTLKMPRWKGANIALNLCRKKPEECEAKKAGTCNRSHNQQEVEEAIRIAKIDRVPEVNSMFSFLWSPFSMFHRCYPAF